MKFVRELLAIWSYGNTEQRSKLLGKMTGILMLKRVVHIVTILPLIYSYCITIIPKQATADAHKETVPMEAELKNTARNYLLQSVISRYDSINRFYYEWLIVIFEYNCICCVSI